MSIPPGRSLASVLRSTLTLIDYYGEQRGYASKLHELKRVITRTIQNLEEEVESSSSDGSTPETPEHRPKEAKAEPQTQSARRMPDRSPRH